MASIKPLASIVEKWTRVTPGRQADFESGVRAPSRDWAASAAAAEQAWEDGTSAAVARKGYQAGVRKAGTEKWSRKTLGPGVQRWGPGVRDAGPDYQSGFETYHRVIESTTLPPRRAVGDPGNLDRVAAIANALHQAKVRAAGGS